MSCERASNKRLERTRHERTSLLSNLSEPLKRNVIPFLVTRGNRIVRRAYSIFALTCFFVSLFVHVTTFFRVDPSKHVPWVWALHIGIFIVFIPMFFVQGLTPKKDFWTKIYATMPRWASYTIKGFFAYALINFALFFFLSRGGVPEIRDGKYVLHNHGNIIRELSEDEYELQMAYVVRGFSGHWMVFYLMPAVIFWYRGESAHLESFQSGRV